MPSVAHALHRLAARRLTSGVAIACAVVAAPVFAQVDEVRELVESGRSVQAFEKYCAGTEVRPALDLWCGIAAVDAGRASVGVLTLERYVLNNPNDTRGHLELARAYFYAGDDARARQEFEAVAALRPPREVMSQIDRYLDGLGSREAQYKTQGSAFVEIGGGYDSNINAGVSQADISLPVFGRVTVAQLGTQRGDHFSWTSLGGSLNVPVRPGLAIFGSISANGTYYPGNSDFNLGGDSAAIGSSYQSGANIFAASINHGDIVLDDHRYRSSNGFGLEWRHQLSELASLAIAPQYSRFDYADLNKVRDSDFAAIAVNYRRVWLTNWQPSINAGVFYGEEHNRNDRPDLGRKLWGVSLDTAASPFPAWSVNASISYSPSRYEGELPLIEVTRHDKYFSAGAGAMYFISKSLSARFEYTYSNNDSNLELYQFKRHLTALKLRYELK